ncbi:hypothetical protein COU03_02490 [bacterium (Candidatus Gribaldobacteria) CG10_big_fil_rev_8_21_14_0_10_41_12]|uniref:Uncharacterized protein n=1 Tax=bacterium (Candidatus Gribaldobacteria) CG10_big_fil_rev_8_21_14_0_10_41_12 TaxID=2014277 RepID=A0A2H0UYJ4_9BACT|nr:MAG: hypothetical protein COU03_02490 [bacterium (Candidatus Gribaldobacteria) CG10_big_fil_rev_8_21_14_0_10_41_12]
MLLLHLEPINPVVSGGFKNPNLVVGFALRCFQCLSLTNVATQQCSWQNNWHTRGWLRKVLSSIIPIFL